MASNKKYWKSVEELDENSTIVEALQQNEFVTDTFQVLEIYENFIVVRVEAKDEFEVFMSGQINPREGN